MPDATAIPKDLRAMAPAPEAKISGVTPKIKVIEVIKMGLKRFNAAFAAASGISWPALR